MIDESNLRNTSPSSWTGMADGRNRKGKIVYFKPQRTEAVHKVVEAAARLQIEHPLYAFYRRLESSKLEVSTLMDLLIKALRQNSIK